MVGIFRGVVTDKSTGLRLADVRVKYGEGDTLTAANGSYSIRGMESTSGEVSFRKSGYADSYHAIAIGPWDDLVLDVELDPAGGGLNVTVFLPDGSKTQDVDYIRFKDLPPNYNTPLGFIWTSVGGMSGNVVIKKSGYKDASRHVSIDFNEDVGINMTLEEEAAPPPPELPGFWENIKDVWNSALSFFGWIIGTPIIFAINSLHRLMTGVDIDETKAGQWANYIPGINTMYKLAYGKDLSGSADTSISDMEWVELAIFLTPIPHDDAFGWWAKSYQYGGPTATTTAIKKLISQEAAIVSRGISLTSLRTLVNNFLRWWWRKQVPLTSSIWQKLLARKGPIFYLVAILGAAMGFGAWGSWAATDNVATAIKFDVKILAQKVKDGVITKEDALYQLGVLRSYFDSAKIYMDVNFAINPIVKFLTPTFNTNMELMELELDNYKTEIEAAGPPPPAEDAEIFFSSTPMGAKIYIDGVYKYVATNILLTVPSGTHNYTLTLDGYENFEGQYHVPAGESITTDDTLTPLPGVEHGNIYITSTPTNAKIYVDGDYKYADTPTVLKLVVGTHEITLKKEGYQDAIDTVNIEKDTTQTINMTLIETPGEEKATVTVTSTPSGASIYLENVYLYEETNTTISIEPGRKKLGVKKEGYKDQSQTRDFEAGEHIDIDFDLVEIPAEQKATVHITSTPSNAKIYLDDEYQHQSTDTTITFLIGNRKITLKKDGFLDKSTTKNFSQGTNPAIHFDLEEIPGEEKATVNITSSPSNAKIYLDDEFHFQYTDTTITFLIGNRKITLKKEGFLDKSVTKDFTQGSNPAIHFDLEELPSVEKARINITSTPTGAKIYVDDVFNYNYSNTTIVVEPGSRKITLKKWSYEDKTITQTFDPDSTTDLYFDLTGAAPPPPPPPPPPPGTITLTTQQKALLEELWHQGKISNLDMAMIISKSDDGTLTRDYMVSQIGETNTDYVLGGAPPPPPPGEPPEETLRIPLEPVSAPPPPQWNCWKINVQGIDSTTNQDVHAGIWINGEFQDHYTPWSFYLEPEANFEFMLRRTGYYQAIVNFRTKPLP